MSAHQIALREAFDAAGRGDPGPQVGRLAGEVLDTTIMMVHRFTRGKVTGDAGVCPAVFEDFWRTTGITG